MSTFLHSYELNGVKESVADFISNLSPQDTPFTSMTPKVSEHNVNFSWLTDVDDIPTVATGVVGGADAVFANLSEPKTLSSFTQIFQRAAKVDGTAEAMGLYGRGKPMAYQMTKCGRVLRKEIEVTMLAKQGGIAASSGVGGQLDGFATRRAGATAPRIDTVVKSKTKSTFSEAELQDLLLKIYTKGGNANVIMYPPEYAAAFSALRATDRSTNMFDGEVAVDVNRKVEVYVDPLGQEFKLVVNRWMPKDLIYVFDPKMFEQHVLRNFFTKDLPANGDYVAKQIIVELGLANKNPDAAGIYNLTGADL